MKTLHLMMNDSETAAMRHLERHAQARGQSGGKARPGARMPRTCAPRGGGCRELGTTKTKARNRTWDAAAHGK